MNAHMEDTPLPRWALLVVLANALAVTILIGGEAVFLALALDWSLISLLNLPPVVYVPFGGVLVGLAGWASVAVFRNALAIERRLIRNDRAL